MNVRQFRRERVGAHAEVGGVDVRVGAQLVAALDHRPVGRTVRDDPDFRVRMDLHDRAWNPLAGGFELPGQAVDVAHVIVGALAVLAPFVVT